MRKVFFLTLIPLFCILPAKEKKQKVVVEKQVAYDGDDEKKKETTAPVKSKKQPTIDDFVNALLQHGK